jgi:hypothetical protein
METIMTHTNEESLIAALDAAAPDGDSWLKGQAAFYSTIEGNNDIEAGYYAALDAAAPDEESWKRGELALLTHGKLTNHDTSSEGWFTRLKNRFKNVDGKPVDSFKTLITRRSRSTQPGKE